MTSWPEQPVRVDFHLLDRQILTSDGRPYAKVDDLEFTSDAGGVPYLAAILVGQQALGDRIGGHLGTWMAAIARRLHPAAHPAPARIPIELVDTVDSAVKLSVPLSELPPLPLEEWCAQHVIDRIPGADHESE